ncbi:hypothetical protein Tco_1392907 [Tanacetum coccineum]
MVMEVVGWLVGCGKVVTSRLKEASKVVDHGLRRKHIVYGVNSAFPVLIDFILAQRVCTPHFPNSSLDLIVSIQKHLLKGLDFNGGLEGGMVAVVEDCEKREVGAVRGRRAVVKCGGVGGGGQLRWGVGGGEELRWGAAMGVGGGGELRYIVGGGFEMEC